MTINNNSAGILVLGSTGKTGSRVAARLQALNIPVRMGSRKAAIPFDWDNQATWQAALQGITAVYIAFAPDLAIPGTDNTIRLFTRVAVQQGVQQLVLLSGRGEPEAARCEAIVQQSGLQWTIIRASWFMQNFSESYLLEPVLAGHMALPAGDTGEPFVDADDIADVAVAALTQPGHANQLYEVTGPRLLTFREAVAEIAAATDRAIQYEQVSSEAYASMLNEYGVPADVTALLSYLFSEVLDGRNAATTNGIQRALGRLPRDFRQFLQSAVATGQFRETIEQLTIVPMPM
ncbi:NAD(P)H-binding protein [Deminuibacter soli]|uniref:NmrA family transcriptional regulator n=1 Tax=Deminuibacter soli TaxID=2291815 RepID=A0A3E1NFL4_9BACT|nr:NAD(P)H-binding protein [Deminuibacter soli]RFM26765.1 NmrA family transcriptional regulator [Deminuibacter soli]